MQFRALFSLCAFIYPFQTYSLIFSNPKILSFTSKKGGLIAKLPPTRFNIAKMEIISRSFLHLTPISRSFFSSQPDKILPRYYHKASCLRMGDSTEDTANSNKNDAMTNMDPVVELEPPNECIVRCLDGEPHLTVTLDIEESFKSLSRMQDDAVGDAIKRLAAMNREILNKNAKRSRSSPDQKKMKSKKKGKRDQNGSPEENEQTQVGVSLCFDHGEIEVE
jgi:hypothetical protein